MFAKLPQSLPFGKHLLPDEAKLAFRSQPGGIARLASVRVSVAFACIGLRKTDMGYKNIPESDSYWDQVCLSCPVIRHF